MEVIINFSIQISFLTQELTRRQLANDQHQRVPRQGWNPCMPMGQFQHVGNPYLNTYDLGCQYHHDRCELCMRFSKISMCSYNSIA